jgi:hypothetical protein
VNLTRTDVLTILGADAESEAARVQKEREQDRKIEDLTRQIAELWKRVPPVPSTATDSPAVTDESGPV